MIDRLVAEFLRTGSVNALAEALSEAQDRSVIYPNRIHALLSDDPSKSINTTTLEALEEGLSKLGAGSGGGVDVEVRAKVQRAYAVERSTGAGSMEEVIGRVSAELAVPPAVIRHLAGLEGDTTRSTRPGKKNAGEADWSWQDVAVDRCLRALRKGPSVKAGLVVPTGGGKTRIALRVILRWLAEEGREDTKVVWATHRRRLRQQARRALHELLENPELIPEGAPRYLAERVEFGLVQTGAVDAIERLGEEGISLLVVDEAHHAAAPSYEPLVELGVPGLFLTATPNRNDRLPIGIDEIAYSITYRELFKRGCVIDPTFHPPQDMPRLDWEHPEGLQNLADYLLDQSEEDFSKVLVAVTRVDRTKVLHEAIVDLLDSRPGHPLGPDDIVYVHGGGTSGGAGDPTEFLDEFSARRRGILIGTSQLLGEGFNDPYLDAAVITYPSESISHLMQVAGRVMRAAPGKDAAHIVQVRESSVQYHFENRWLYQDISDRLRPDLRDFTYATPEGLYETMSQLLEQHNVPSAERDRILGSLDDVVSGEEVSLMLTGLPYWGSRERFEEHAQWNGILVSSAERDRFVQIFNDASDRDEEVREQATYLSQRVGRREGGGRLIKAYSDLLFAAGAARGEVAGGSEYPSQAQRPYRRGGGTTWLRYVTFRFEPHVPEALDEFLKDAVNRESLLTMYLSHPEHWRTAAKIQLPLAGSVAALLDSSQTDWLREARSELISRIRQADDGEGFSIIRGWRVQLQQVPLPIIFVDEINQLLRPTDFDALTVVL